MQPIYKQFIEPDCEFPFNRLNRNLCFGGGGGGGVPAIKAPSLNLPAPNLDQRLNLNQKATRSINTEQFGTPSTGNAPSIQGPPALDTSGLDTLIGAPKRLLDETIGPEGLLAYPYRQLSVYNSPFGGGDGGGDGGDYGTSDAAADTTAEDMATTESTSAMTEEEKQNRIRRLMASRYGRRQTILTGGTGIQGFGEV